MNNLRRYLTLAALLSFAGVTYAAGATLTPGEYKLVVRNAAPCTITLSADGVASAGACADARVRHWRQTGSTLELDEGSDVYAVLHTSSDGYAGKTIEQNASLTLTPTSQTAAVSH